jgi:hypothetical protein
LLVLNKQLFMQEPYYIVVGIDGTSSVEWMRKDGSNSHTHKFIQDFKGSTTYGINKQWYHGTSEVVFDGQSAGIVQTALDFIVSALRRKFPSLPVNRLQPFEMFDVNSCKQSEYYNQITNEGSYFANAHTKLKLPVRVDAAAKHQSLTISDVRIVLIGHSRGAMATTVLAKMLSPIVKVYFMGLYDSVDRNQCLDSTVIENVQYAYHAMRSDEMGSRSTFGHSSTKAGAGVQLEAKIFYTSHGGLGGDYVSDPKKATITGDSSCIPQPAQKIVYTGGGDSHIVDNTHALSKIFGKPINEICEDGKRSADAYIRDSAKEKGLPL